MSLSLALPVSGNIQKFCFCPHCSPFWFHITALILFQMDVDEETAEIFYQKLLELEKQILTRLNAH